MWKEAMDVNPKRRHFHASVGQTNHISKIKNVSKGAFKKVSKQNGCFHSFIEILSNIS